jgi:DNA polymerase III delta prime subunit
MELSIEPLIYIGIFVGVLLLVEGVYLAVFGKSISLNARVNRRLAMLEQGASREDVLAQLRKEMPSTRAACASRSIRSSPTRPRRRTSPFRPNS